MGENSKEIKEQIFSELPSTYSWVNYKWGGMCVCQLNGISSRDSVWWSWTLLWDHRKSSTHASLLAYGSIFPQDKRVNPLNSPLFHGKHIPSGDMSIPTYLNFPQYHLLFPPLGFALLKKEKYSNSLNDGTIVNNWFLLLLFSL